MCGIAGFFTGCEFAETCAASDGGVCRALTAGAAAQFEGWYSKASVRRAPRRQLDPSDTTRDLFPRHLVPHINHPIVQHRYADCTHTLLTHALYRFLAFTVNLETLVVNDTTRRLAMHELPIGLDGDAVLNAQRLAVDEAYHALFCADLLQQTVKLTGISPVNRSRPRFMDRLDQLAGISDSPAVTRFLFTAVSEMLITGTLVDARGQGEVPEAVRGVMADHAADEARHHVFYRELLTGYLSSLPRAQAREVASLLPDAILAYMRPDTAAVTGELRAVGLSEDEAAQIVTETYVERDHSDYIRSCSREIKKLLESLDLMPAPQVSDRFEATALAG